MTHRVFRVPALVLAASFLLTAPAAAALAPLPPAAQQAFAAIRDDRPPPQIVRGIHYVISNENRHFQYQPALRDPGGVYVGVGTDQNYLLAGWSRPEVLVLLDFDQVVVDLHRVYRLAFLSARTPEEFLALWRPKSAAAMRQMITEGYPDERLRAAALRAFRIGRHAVHRRLNWIKRTYSQRGVPTFVTDQQQYDYVAALFQANRVFMVRGDLTADRSVNDVAAAARIAGLPVRTLYLSNAERYFKYTPDFRRSMLSLPVDERTLVLRTSNFRVKCNCYVYSAQSGPNFHAWLKRERTTSAKTMLVHKEIDRGTGLAYIRATPEQTAPAMVARTTGRKLPKLLSRDVRKRALAQDEPATRWLFF
jgi:hypothetical protein